jgi:putative endonuclease
MASRSLNLYTGVTDDVFRRALEHKSGTIEGFTKRYNINRLVYYETFRYINNAIAREKQIKAWTRAKRIALIKSINPAWQDLAEDWGERVELQIPRSARDDNRDNKDEIEREFHLPRKVFGHENLTRTERKCTGVGRTVLDTQNFPAKD